MRTPPRVPVRPAVALFAVLALLAVTPAALLGRQRVATAGDAATRAVQPVGLAEFGDRILIVAPHPDDEVLAAGGLVHRALSSGRQVWVVMMTPGESSPLAAMLYRHTITPRPADYTALGRERLNESRTALARLGLPAGRLVVLGYADGSLAHLWTEYWSCRRVRVSGGDQVAAVPRAADYYRPGAPYCGGSVVADLVSVLRAVRPTSVVFPDTSERHPDHWATGAFVEVAVAQYEAGRGDDGPADHPGLFTYLVHEPGWPLPRRAQPGAAQTLPAAIAGFDPHACALALAPADISAKETALSAYRTQLPLDGFLFGFVRKTELYFNPPRYRLSTDAEVWSGLPAAQALAMARSADGSLLVGLRKSLLGDQDAHLVGLSARGRIDLRVTHTGAGDDGVAVSALWSPAGAAPSVGTPVHAAVTNADGAWLQVRIDGLPPAQAWFAGALREGTANRAWIAPFRWFLWGSDAGAAPCRQAGSSNANRVATSRLVPRVRPRYRARPAPKIIQVPTKLTANDSGQAGSGTTE